MGDEIAREEKKQSQIDTQLKKVNMALDGLGGVIATLGDQLSGVMRDPEPQKEVSSKEDEVLVSVAGQIRSIRMTIEDQIDKVNDYRDRLEV